MFTLHSMLNRMSPATLHKCSIYTVTSDGWEGGALATHEKPKVQQKPIEKIVTLSHFQLLCSQGWHRV